MNTFNRREFFDRSTQAGLGLASATVLANAQSVWGAPAANKITLGVVGTGGRGSNLCDGFLERPDCSIAWVADVDLKRAEAVAARIGKKQGQAPKVVQDFRTVLDQKDVDAVVVATPDHWHALATIWACQAGKDVYVEKPPTHSCWEGRKMVEAARKYKRIVQVGTQSRSGAYNIAARKYIADGNLGKIHFCRIYDQKDWGNFPVKPDCDPPAGFNWDLFNGPAPEAKFNPNFRNGWHHFWRYSSGDIVNDSIHQIDLARYILGVDYPKTVYSTGGRYFQEGAAETPDTQIAVFEFDKMVVSFEMTLYTPYMLKIAPVIRMSTTEFPYWHQCATRIEIYGSKGLMVVGRHGGGWQVFTRPKLHESVVKDQCKGLFPDPEHKENFFACIRTRNTPNADIEEGHRSILLGHLATISYRLGGQKLVLDGQTEKIVGNDETAKYYRREYRKPFVIEDQV